MHKEIKAKLENYKVRYSENLIETLDNSLEEIRRKFDITNSLLEKIGMAVSPYARHVTHPDEAKWFGKLEYKVDGKKLAILIPWANEGNISISSSEEIPIEKIKNLLDKIANQMRQYPQ